MQKERDRSSSLTLSLQGKSSVGPQRVHVGGWGHSFLNGKTHLSNDAGVSRHPIRLLFARVVKLRFFGWCKLALTLFILGLNQLGYNR